MSREHAILSASGAHRWMVCTPSARLEEHYPDTHSESASEGTFAHAFAELLLDELMKKIDIVSYKRKYKQMAKDQFWSKSLEEYVNEYVSYVVECYEESLQADEGAALLTEQRLDFSQWVPQGFGRGDAVIIADGTMHVIDLKYGKNVAVRAENNPQLRLYALGAYAELSCLYNIDTVQMSIVQPRNGGISVEVLSVEKLLEWGNTVKTIAEVAIRGEGELVAGEHCRFCKAAVRCKKMAEKMEKVKSTALSPDELTDDELAAILGEAENVLSWLHKVQDYALTEARDNGKKWPGFKLVEGRSNRIYTDEEAVAKTLIGADYTEEDIYKPRSLKGITDMQKLLGKKNFDSLLDGLVAKPQGKPALVPESDKRPEWHATVDEFEDLDAKENK